MTKSRGIRNSHLKHRRREFLEFLATTRFVERDVEPLTKEWWRANATNVHNTVPLVCSVCHHVVAPTFDGFFSGKRQGRAGCRCSGHGTWATEQARQELLMMIHDAGFRPLEFLTSAEAYAAEGVNAHTRLPIECTKCHVRPHRTPLYSFRVHGSAECNCRWKTQRFVHEGIEQLIEEIAPECMFVVGESWFNDKKSTKNRRMPYDVVVCRRSDAKVLLIIEIDGRHHFVDEFAFRKEGPSDHDQVLKNDVDKEIHAMEKHIPMVRLFQPTVYEKFFRRGGFDWKPYLKRMLRQAWEETLPPKIYRQPGESLYRSGQYRAMRVGTIVEVS